MTSPPWSSERAQAWWARQTPPRGFNYLPRTAVNSLEMWQAESFDPGTIRQELGWAARHGYTALRVFLPFAVWAREPDTFKERLGHFLDLAAESGLSVMPILFDDCAFANREPKLGVQARPVAGIHNSGWVPSPGPKLALDRSAWPQLRAYVQDLLSSFAHDARVLIWDLYNEPGNGGMGARSLPLVEAAFGWAREAQPAQPLTVAPWHTFEGSMSRRMFELSDVVSFHAYEGPFFTEAALRYCAGFGRPLLCSEWLHRPNGNTFAAILPLFERSGAGWYQWGLVAGRTQTYLPWGGQPGDPEPDVWQHDVLRPDGTPYNPAELALVGDWAGEP